jgi:ATP-dependent protease HslVU (ClpYQ) peptidase subunit
MTIVAAIKDGDAIVVCCDGAASDGSEFSIRRGNPKVWKIEVPFLGTAILGFAGTFSICQLIRYKFKVPEFDHTTLQSYLVDFQLELNKFLKETRETYEPKEVAEYTLLFAAKSQILVLYPNGDVEENAEDYNAIGDGAQVAMGALGVLSSSSCPSWEKLQVMFDIVKKNRATIQGKILFETVGM